MLAIVIGAWVVAQAVGSGIRCDTLERWAGQRPLRTVFFAITIGVLISVAAPLLSPLSALRTLLWYGRSVHTRDTGVIGSDYRQAAEELGDEVRASGCFFTLTSEGVWYYFFSTPSCSRFHHLVYARSRAAQSELIAALERGRPSLILFSNRFWSNNIDKLSVFNSNAPVARHVMASYRPYRLVGSHWFWQRAESPYRFDDGPAGSLDPVPSQVSRRRDVIATGSLTTVPSDPDAVAVFVTLGEDNIPIWAGRTVKREGETFRFHADVPTASLDPGAVLLRFWMMTDAAGPLKLLGAVRVTVLPVS
jgi:hypothetical protein